MTANDVIQFYGSQVNAAKAAGVTKGAVSQWLKNGLPDERQFQYAILTKGELQIDPKLLVADQ